MALEPGQIDIDRVQVTGWIKSYQRLKNPKINLEGYIRMQVDKLNLPDAMVNTDVEGREHLPNEVHVADLIIADLPSYGVKIAPGS
jgi:hypothetical protein